MNTNTDKVSSKKDTAKDHTYLDLNIASGLGLVIFTLVLFAVFGLLKYSHEAIQERISAITYSSGQTFYTKESIAITVSNVHTENNVDNNQLCAAIKIDGSNRSTDDTDKSNLKSAKLWNFSARGSDKKELKLASVKTVSDTGDTVLRHYCWREVDEVDNENSASNVKNASTAHDKDEEKTLSEKIIDKYKEVSQGRAFIQYKQENSITEKENTVAQWKSPLAGEI